MVMSGGHSACSCSHSHSTMGLLVSVASMPLPPRSWSSDMCETMFESSRAMASSAVLAHVHPSGGLRMSSTQIFVLLTPICIVVRKQFKATRTHSGARLFYRVENAHVLLLAVMANTGLKSTRVPVRKYASNAGSTSPRSARSILFVLLGRQKT